MKYLSTAMLRQPLELHYRLAVFRRDEYTCRHCGSRPGYAGLEVDHIIPVALGGRDHFENLQTLCGPCNRRKGARFIG